MTTVTTAEPPGIEPGMTMTFSDGRRFTILAIETVTILQVKRWTIRRWLRFQFWRWIYRPLLECYARLEDDSYPNRT